MLTNVLLYEYVMNLASQSHSNISFSADISINASKCPRVNVDRSRLFISFRVLKTRSQLTWLTDKLRIYSYAAYRFEYAVEFIVNE